jgi:hypothetical protein
MPAMVRAFTHRPACALTKSAMLRSEQLASWNAWIINLGGVGGFLVVHRATLIPLLPPLLVSLRACEPDDPCRPVTDSLVCMV